MSVNEIKNLIKETKKNNKIKLNLTSKGLTSLPPEVLELENLTQLYLSNNQLTSLPPGISRLENLMELYLFNNNLTSLPPEILDLRKLTKLYLTGNKLTSLPCKISKLRNLAELDLSNNQLTFLPPEISMLENLTKLDLRNNHLTILPREILDLNLNINWESIVIGGIFLENNPFEYPPIEIVKKGRNAITDYFNSLQGNLEQLSEVKVLLIGDGGVGKTSLVNRLTNRSYNKGESQTPGVSINEWTVENAKPKIKVNVWDFGGQEIMHATHQFFLSKRSLYILVLDSRKDDKVEYWLKNIQSFGGTSPILIVINKIDENTSFDLNRTFLKEKYPSIIGFYRVSCATNDGIEDFSEKLRQELARIEHIHIQWPKSWFNVKVKLEDTKNEIISYDEYKKICHDHGINEESTQNTLIDFLNDLGIVIYFKDIPVFDTQILEPKWITGAVYKIINSTELANQNGVLRYNQLDNILRKKNEMDLYYSPEKYAFIINLMKQLELCYEINEKSILVPDLLKVQEPQFDFDYNTALRFIIEYDFLPMSVMTRFMVRVHKNIKDGLCWRTGVVLESEEYNSSAVVKSDIEAKRIHIYVDGEQRKDYFSVIMFNFREINKFFEKIKIIEKIPMLNEPEVTVSYKHLVKLDELGIHKYIPDGSDFEYDVKELLKTINKDKSEEEKKREMLDNNRIANESDTGKIYGQDYMRSAT